MKSVERRIQALEAKMSSDPVILHFADGSTQELRGPRYFLLDLICATGRPNISASQAAQLEAVRRSLWAEEPGGARLTEVIRILPESVEEPDSVAPDCPYPCGGAPLGLGIGAGDQPET